MTAPLPRVSEHDISRRRLLACLGWGTAAPSVLAGGFVPDWGELRLAGLPPATAAGSERPVRLSSNENPYGMCAAARQRFSQTLESANRYPFPWESELVTALAEHFGIAQGSISVGAGSTETLRMSAAAWVGAERPLVQAEPTFETLGAYARSAGHPIRSVPLDAEGRHDLGRMRDAIGAGPAVVYICNPGNPSSTLLAQADLDAFLDDLPGSVIALVDEAYHDFVDAPDYRTQIPRALASDNVVVIRTFSKIYGMAGMRVGYAIAQPQRIRELDGSRTEMSVSVVAAACAATSLRDAAYPIDQAQRNRESRAILTDALDQMGLPYFQSQTNFVMTHLGRPMLPVNEAMSRLGVQVGRLFPALPQHLRVSVGTPSEMERCVEALREVLA